MKTLRYIARNISILNLILVCTAGAFFVYGISPLLSAKIIYKAKPSIRPLAPAVADQAAPAPSAQDYTIIAEANLFHPERKIPVEKKEEKLAPKPELVLYGTVVSGDLSVAYVEDTKSPYTTPGRGKRPKVLRKGDVIGGFTLKEVAATRITLVRNEEVMTVNIDVAKDRGSAPVNAQAAAAPSPQPIQGRSTLSPLVAPGSVPAASRPGIPPAIPPVPAAAQPPQRDLRNPGAR
jgi:hypothetical protein